MKITKITINGFKNIKNTTLKFTYGEKGEVKDVPIIVLLAPNNSGKTNLLEGIQSAFELISKQGVQVADYIENAKNYDNWNVKTNGVFEFEVEFYKSVEEETYTYGFSINYSRDEKNGLVSQGITKEYLESSKLGSIFRRCCNAEDIDKYVSLNKTEEDHGREHILVLYDNNNQNEAENVNSIYRIPHVQRIRNKVYNSSMFLGIHKLGSGAMLATGADGSAEKLLREITGVLVSLTREDIGTIIMREDKSSDFGKSINDLDTLIENAGKMRKNDIENKIDVSVIDRDTGEWGFFKKEFQKLFPCYFPVDESETAYVRIYKDEHTDRYQVAFKDSRKVRPETAATLSFGTRRVFKMLSQVISNKTPLFSVEGIENGLHPEVYIKLVKSLFTAVDNTTYLKEIGKEIGKEISIESRVHDPRLIISSHAPGVVNELEEQYESIYIALETDGDVEFVVLSKEAMADIDKRIDNAKGYYGLGDVIFNQLYSPLFGQKCRKEWFGK